MTGMTVVTAAAVMVMMDTTAQGQASGGGGGTIVGHVKLTATPPPNAMIRMGGDLKCVEINGGKRMPQEVVLRDADGGLRNAFVSVQGSFPKAPPATVAAVIDQRGCVYNPRVQGARVGQTLEVRNSDDTLHNIHSMSTKGNPFNTGQPKPGMVFKAALNNEEVMLHVRCDVHPWMTGYIGILPHPYYAVTAAEGAFTIANVPPGHYKVQAWHERYGPIVQEVDVKAGATATLDFTYSGSEQPSPAPAGFAAQAVTLPAGTRQVALVTAP